METENKRVDEILSKLGLMQRMSSDPKDLDYVDERKLFKRFNRYLSKSYLNSGLQETDEAFRFRNIVFLDPSTGLRFDYSEYESYFGEVEYKLKKIFIITRQREELEVEDVDFETKTVITADRQIPLSDLKKNSKGD